MWQAAILLSDLFAKAKRSHSHPFTRAFHALASSDAATEDAARRTAQARARSSTWLFIESDVTMKYQQRQPSPLTPPSTDKLD